MSDEYMKCLEDGSIEFHIEGKVYKFSRPKFGQYKERVAALYAYDDKHTEAKIAEVSNQLPEREDPAKPTIEERQAEAVWKLERDRRILAREESFRLQLVEWIKETHGMLKRKGDPTWPTTDELPAWLPTNAESMTSRMTDHWRKVPKAPGEKEEPPEEK